MKKGCLIAAGVALVVIAGIILFAFGLTGGVADAGNRFLSQIAAGNVKGAYESASATLKSQQTAGEFEENVKKLGLTDYASASWSNRQMENDRGHLDGTVTTRNGGKIPVTLELIKEAGTWKIFSLNAPASGVMVSSVAASAVTGKDSGKEVPSDERAKALALESLLAFNKAVQEKNFFDFHARCASGMREQFSPDKLQEAFKEFVDKGIDISSIKNSQPSFDSPPAIDADGTLVMNGTYDGKPQVAFKLKYRYEDNIWKVVGINVNLP